MVKKKKTIWVICTACGFEERKHRILHEKNIPIYEDEPPAPPIGYVHHRFVECMGCETIKYVISNSYRELDDDARPQEQNECNFKVYPDVPAINQRRTALINKEDVTDNEGTLLIPVSVRKMFKETVVALNANIRTLAGGGLRATVEAICLDNKINERNLEKKIDELAKRNLLTKAQAELLHEERYLGNAALHELATPSAQDIEDGLQIVEGLINTIYVLPSKAKRLKERREFKKSGGLKEKMTKS